MNEDRRLRLASVADFSALLAIERDCAEASHWSETMWWGLLEQGEAMPPLRAVWVAERSADVLGFVVMRNAGGVAELESVAVKPIARRNGVAHALCREAMAWAAEQGAGQVQLEVRAGNAAALRLYGALSFVELGRRRGYYSDPVEDAVLMARALQDDDGDDQQRGAAQRAAIRPDGPKV
jgi:ribosomal-protein-alanine N-acetyltransferase